MKFDPKDCTATVDESEIHQLFCCMGPFEVPADLREDIAEDLGVEEGDTNWEIRQVIFVPTPEFAADVKLSKGNRQLWENRINRCLKEIHAINDAWHEAFDCT